MKIITGTDSNENEEETESASAQNLEELDLTDQVLVFQYRGKFHAIDHVSAPPFFLFWVSGNRLIWAGKKLTP